VPEVSIPHRYAENGGSPLFKKDKTLVSIPHRYAENLMMTIYLPVLLQFQFLIGTLKTCFTPIAAMIWVMFQFLIGTLKTGLAGRSAEISECVSIPHRYAENS